MIDPIPVAEELKRIAQARNVIAKRERAGQALDWFSEYALTPKGDGPRKVRPPVVGVGVGVLPPKLVPVASSTPNAAEATDYLSRAFRLMHVAIIEKAIALALADFAE